MSYALRDLDWCRASVQGRHTVEHLHVVQARFCIFKHTRLTELVCGHAVIRACTLNQNPVLKPTKESLYANSDNVCPEI